MKFRIFLTNFGYYSQEEPDTLDGAKDVCRRAGFQATVEQNGKTVATYCPLWGFRTAR